MLLRKQMTTLLIACLAAGMIATLTPLSGPGAAAQSEIERLRAERDSATTWWAQAEHEAGVWKAKYFREVEFDTLHQIQSQEQIQAVHDMHRRRVLDAGIVAATTSLILTLIFWISTKISSK